MRGGTIHGEKLTRLFMEGEECAPIVVLVIEDSRTVRAQLRKFLSLLDNVSVEEAASMAAAKAILERRGGEIFCAVVDLLLPDAHGMQCVETVRFFGVPTIVLTGTHDSALRRSAIAARSIDYVVKEGANAIEEVAYLVGRLRQNSGMKVLIVDDSATFRMRARELLKRYCYVTLEAADAETALALLEDHPDTALVLTDYHMPGMDGIELIRQIRRRHRREDLAIIALSQSHRPDLSAAMLKAGANDYLHKNFLAEEFFCRVVQNTNMVHYVRELQNMANRDYLTRLHNRRHLFTVAEALLQDVRRAGCSLAVAMVDADHFKRINDRHGHAAGDEALRRIAQTLRKQSKRGDVVARYGGEEFVCVARLAHPDEAWPRFEELRARIAAIDLVWEGAQVPISVSIGLATQGDSLVEMLEMADQAVFHAKAEGRDRVVPWPFVPQAEHANRS